MRREGCHLSSTFVPHFAGNRPQLEKALLESSEDRSRSARTLPGHDYPQRWARRDSTG